VLFWKRLFYGSDLAPLLCTKTNTVHKLALLRLILLEPGSFSAIMRTNIFAFSVCSYSKVLFVNHLKFFKIWQTRTFEVGILRCVRLRHLYSFFGQEIKLNCVMMTLCSFTNYTVQYCLDIIRH